MGEAVSEKLAANIRRLREEHGLSQQRMADRSGVPRPTWANLESGNANPTVSVLTRVASALGVALEELLSTPKAEIRLVKATELPQRKRGQSRALSLIPAEARSLEFQRLELGAEDTWSVSAHPSGTQEVLVCETGRIQLTVGTDSVNLSPGDVALFRADQRHLYRNPGRRAASAYSLVTVALLD